MVEVNSNPDVGYQGGSIRDLEEAQRNLRDRLVLVGQNLIDFKERSEDEILEIKKDIEIMKNSIQKVTSFIETLSQEFSKFAKKDDLNVLVKQAKMFQPMEFVKKSDLEKLKSSGGLK